MGITCLGLLVWGTARAGSHSPGMDGAATAPRHGATRRPPVRPAAVLQVHAGKILRRIDF